MKVTMSMKITIASLFLLMSMFSFGCDPRYGLLESMFELSPESRFPKWFAVPKGYTREDLSVTIDYYSHPFGTNVQIIIYGPMPDHEKLIEKHGTERWHPYTEQQFQKHQSYDLYPTYSIITVDGIEEVLEQRRLEPILYITDDPKLTAWINQKKTNKR